MTRSMMSLGGLFDQHERAAAAVDQAEGEVVGGEVEAAVLRVLFGGSRRDERDERRARAKDLLRTTSLPCEEIAAACGICDASHLAHLFRRRFGATPSSFRKGS